MRVISGRFNVYSLTKHLDSSPFRYAKPVLGTRRVSIIPIVGTLNNGAIEYNLTTTPLIAGTYKFKERAMDSFNNINQGVETSVTMTDIPWWPRNLAIALKTANTVTLTWSKPLGGAAIGGYKIYGNGGNGGAIDRDTVLATTTGINSTSCDVTVADGIWMFVVESVASGSGYESLNYWTVGITLPVENTVPTSPDTGGETTAVDNGVITYPTNVSLKNVSIGRCQLVFPWSGDSNVAYFDVFYDSGTGTINWTTRLLRQAVQNTTKQTILTERLKFTDGASEYKFGIRSVTQYGVSDQNTIEYSVYIDGMPPLNAFGMKAVVK